MKIRFNDIEINISFYFLAVLSLMLVIGKNVNTLYMFMFCILHEFGHLTSMIIFKKKLRKIELGYYGVRIVTSSCHVSRIKETIILISGPLVNLLLFLFFYHNKINEKADINSALFIFNLLPVGQLDGGNILSLFINNKIKKIISLTFNIIIIILGIIIMLQTRSNFSILLVGLYILTCQIG